MPTALPVEEQAELLKEAVASGAAGLCLAANRLATPAAAAQALPLLAAAAVAGVPVFVHPGPVAAGAAGARQPSWWAPSTGYVAQQHAAWHAFQAVARPQLPALRVIFALLAGLAPLHAERTAARGGPGASARSTTRSSSTTPRPTAPRPSGRSRRRSGSGSWCTAATSR